MLASICALPPNCSLVQECPAGTFCLDWAPCVSYWSSKKRLA